MMLPKHIRISGKHTDNVDVGDGDSDSKIQQQYKIKKQHKKNER